MGLLLQLYSQLANREVIYEVESKANVQKQNLVQ